MKLLQELYHAIPSLSQAIQASPFLQQEETLWSLLQLFMTAHSPTGGVSLPGTIGEALAQQAESLGLSDAFLPNFRDTGNAAIWLGTRKEKVDLLVDAHLDKPGFGVSSVGTENGKPCATLFACCANRYPMGEYQVAAKVVRYIPEQQAVAICGRGQILSRRASGATDELYITLLEGDIRQTDMVLMDVPPQKQGSRICGTGIDDGAGTTILLVTAHILRYLEPLLLERGWNCLFTFSDQEEWPPTSFFSSGASRTTFALEPPTLGSIVVDVHTADKGYQVEVGQGLCSGFISSQGRGAIVPLNYQSLLAALIPEINEQAPKSVQHNPGYFSRSDDFALMRWSRILGLFGVPAERIHCGDERGDLQDIRGGILFLSHYIPIVLGLSETLNQAFSLRLSNA